MSCKHLAYLLLLLGMSSGSTLAQEELVVVATSGQQVANAVALWGAKPGLGYNMTVVLDSPYITMLGTNLTAIAPAVSGHLTITGNSSTGLGYGKRSTLDASMRVGLLPALSTAQLLISNLNFINNCETQGRINQQWGFSYIGNFNGVGLWTFTPFYQSITSNHCVIYVRQAEFRSQVYLKTIGRVTFPPIKAVLGPVLDAYPQIKFTFSWIKPYEAMLKTLEGPAGLMYNTMVKSTSDPDDPLLQWMRSRGLLMAPHFCNGTLLPPELANAKVDPMAPAWVVATSAELSTAMAEAAQFTSRPDVKWRPPPEIMLSSNVSLPASTPSIPAFATHVVFMGQLNDDPDYLLNVQLDLQRANNTLKLGPGAQLFIQQLTLTGLAQGPLPTSPSTSSAFPLAAVTPPPGTDPVAGVPYVWLHNVTLVLPPEDYLAVASIALVSTPDDIGRCLEADVTARAAQLQPGIHSAAVTASAADHQWLELSSMLGWGLNATSLRLVPSSPVPGFSGCVPAQPSSTRCGSVTCGQLAGIVAGSVCVLCILLGVLLLWLRPKAAHRSQLKHQAQVCSAYTSSGTSSNLTSSVQIELSSNNKALDSINKGSHSANRALDGLAHRLTSMLGQDSIHNLLGIPDEEGAAASNTSGGKSNAQSLVQTLGTDSRALVGLVEQKALHLGKETDQVVIQSIIGTGSFGHVYAGVWRGLKVALKTVVFEELDNRQAKAITEAAIAISVNHPNVVSTYHYDIKPICTAPTQDPGGLQIVWGRGCQDEQQAHHGLAYKLYLIQELCHTTLSASIGNHALMWEDGSFDWLAILSILHGVACGLEFIHSRNIIHGDLKPENILLKVRPVGYENGVDAKLADFGLSTHLDANATHVSNVRGGTPFYMAPEVLAHGHTSQAADVYSMGIIIWECAAQCRPFILKPDSNPTCNPAFLTIPPDTPPELKRLTSQCLSNDPHQRPTANEIRRTLALLVNNVP